MSLAQCSNCCHTVQSHPVPWDQDECILPHISDENIAKDLTSHQGYSYEAPKHAQHGESESTPAFVSLLPATHLTQGADQLNGSSRSVTAPHKGQSSGPLGSIVSVCATNSPTTTTKDSEMAFGICTQEVLILHR